MNRRNSRIVAVALAGVAALALALPATGQNSPESLLPPGFGDSAPPPAPAAPNPADGAAPAPVPAPGNEAAPAPSLLPSDLFPLPPGTEEAELTEAEIEAEKARKAASELPAASRRPMDFVGLLSPEQGGLGEDAFRRTNGRFLTRLMFRLDAPVASRWVSILLNRAALSRVPTPAGVSDGDWIAARALMLVRNGDADGARLLIQSVDTDRFTPRMITVSKEISLASADMAGMCPFTNVAAQHFPGDLSWGYARAICASLTGEGGLSSMLLDKARGKRARNIDYRLAEKVVGAGRNTRRASLIEWNEASRLTAWRFGTAASVGLAIPESLYATAGPNVQAWRARAPMYLPEDRLDPAHVAATIGIFSNASLVDLYGQVYERQGDVDRDAPVAQLRLAYAGDTPKARMDAMRSLWADRQDKAGGRYGGLILTARAAASLAQDEAFQADYANLIASMLSAGLDVQAARWAPLVNDAGISRAPDAWALLAVGAPSPTAVEISRGRVESYLGELGKDNRHKGALFVAALAGLGRISAEDATRLASDLEIDLARQTRWTQAIRAAARAGQPGSVAILAAVGMQTRNWSAVPPAHLYQILSALRQTGNEPAARMIAAEALTRL